MLFVALAAADLEARLVNWDDGSVYLGEFDLVMTRSTWDYPRRRDDFLAWTRTAPNLLNPPDVIEYSSEYVARPSPRS